MKNTHTSFRFVLMAGVIALAWFGFTSVVHAAPPRAGLFTSTGKLVRTYTAIPAGAHVTVADLGTDGVPEIVAGSPQGTKPAVSILRLDGSRIRSFSLGNVTGTPAVRVAAGDVTGDGQKDIVVSFGEGTTPEVRVYSQSGERASAFLAFGKGFRGGVSVAVGDVTGDGRADIITAAGKGGGPFVITYDARGERVAQFKAYPSSEKSGVNVSVHDADADGDEDVVTSTPTKNSLIKMFDAGGRVHASFRAAHVPGTLHAATVPGSQFIVGTASGSAALVTSYTQAGKVGTVNFYPYGKSFTSGVTVASVESDERADIVVVPGNEAPRVGVRATGKSIVVDISEQRLRRYENGVLVATHVVSTGTWSMPTPIGSFAIKNKLSTAYSRRYALYMDNWMAFTGDGAYGIHSLPYWKLKNGSTYYEGTNHLGIRVSHGCIRLSPKESAIVYQWAVVGVPVTIRQ